LVFEPFARERPSPVRGSWAAFEPRSDFRDRESLEHAHFDNRAELGIDAGEFVQESLDLRIRAAPPALRSRFLRQLYMFDQAGEADAQDG
jgi:hypothetical protein